MCKYTITHDQATHLATQPSALIICPNEAICTGIIVSSGDQNMSVDVAYQRLNQSTAGLYQYGGYN